MKTLLGMCTKNCKNTIEYQLDLILSQTRLPDEIIFVDSSDDETPEKIKETLENKIKFKIIEQKCDGLGWARQKIYEYSKKYDYDIIIFLDTEKYPTNIYWCYNHIKFHETHDNYHILNGRFVKKDYEPVSPFRDINYLIQCNCSIKVSIIEKVGGYDVNLKRGEDWDLAIRLYRAGARSFVSKSVAVIEKDVSDAKTTLKKKIYRASSIKFIKKYGLWYVKKYPQHLIADILGLTNMISILLSALNNSFILIYVTSLILFDMGMYISNREILRKGKTLYLLLPLAYGLSTIKDLSPNISNSNRCRQDNHYNSF